MGSTRRQRRQGGPSLSDCPRRRRLGLTGLAVLFLVGCSPSRQAPSPAPGPATMSKLDRAVTTTGASRSAPTPGSVPVSDPLGRQPVQLAALTPDGTDRYTAEVRGTSVTLAAPADNARANLREVFWRDPTDFRDAQTCAVWRVDVDPGESGQQGAALRIVSGQGWVRAVTVTKDIFGLAPWVFNIHAWDSRSTPPGDLLGQIDLSGVFRRQSGDVVPLPWHLCARIVGTTFSFVAWPDGGQAPAWGDATHGGSATVPPGWDGAGKAGWYAGHIHPGASMTFDALSTGEATA